MLLMGWDEASPTLVGKLAVTRKKLTLAALLASKKSDSLVALQEHFRLSSLPWPGSGSSCWFFWCWKIWIRSVQRLSLYLCIWIQFYQHPCYSIYFTKQFLEVLTLRMRKHRKHIVFKSLSFAERILGRPSKANFPWVLFWCFGDVTK